MTESSPHRHAMNPDVKKRLDRLIFMQRLKIGLIALGIAIAVSALLIFVGYEQTINIDKVVSSTPVKGEIVSIIRGAGRKSGYILSVKLDDGRKVQAVSRLPRAPIAGERLVLKEAMHESGQKSYMTTGFVNPPK